MIEQAECLIAFAGPGVNLRECSRRFRPIKSVLRFRQQLDRALSFPDRLFFPAQARKNKAKLPMASGVLGIFAYELLCDDSRAIECGFWPPFFTPIPHKPNFRENI